MAKRRKRPARTAAARLREAYRLAAQQERAAAREEERARRARAKARRLREAYRLAAEQEAAARREEERARRERARRRKKRAPTPPKKHPPRAPSPPRPPAPPKKPSKKSKRKGTFERGAAENITAPPRQRRGEKLTPEQLLPTTPWRSDPKVKKWTHRRYWSKKDGKWKRKSRFDEKFRKVPSDYRDGEAAWFPLPEHTALHMVLNGQHPITLDVIKEHAIQVFKRSGRAHLRFRALLLYWYPDNPAYRGALVRVSVVTPQGGTKFVEKNLSKLAQTWKPMWTKWMFGSTPDGVERAVDAAFYRENQNGVSPANQAEERVIYLVAYELYTFDNVTPPPTEELTGSPLRAV